MCPTQVRLDPEDPTRTPQIGLLDAGLAYEVTDHKSFLDVVYHLMLCEGHAAGLGTGSQPPGVGDRFSPFSRGSSV